MQGNIRDLQLKIKIILIILASVFLTACTQPKTSPPQTAANVDLNKYMGTWYEIASLPNYFQRGCSCTTATYELKKDYVAVHNRCYKLADQKFANAHAKGFAIPGSNNSKLKVQFFWPFRGKYWILYVDKKYQNAVVGTPNRNYLWILSRKPSLDPVTYHQLTSIAAQQDYPIEKLNLTIQNCN